MKKVFSLSFTLLFLFTSTIAWCQAKEKKEKKRYEHFKERNISKTYPAGNNLNIENKFGNVKITTWDKNEIKVDVHIEASSTDKEFAEKSFERIVVNDSQEGKNINFKTSFNENKDKIGCSNCSNTLIIDYDVHLPANTPLTIMNSFGGIEIPDYAGKVSLTSKYGSLDAGKLSNVEKIIVEFGSADLRYISDLDLEFKYSSINIGSLAGDCKLKMSFCGYSKINLDKTLKSLILNDSYSKIHLVPADNLGASYTVNTSYGSFVDNTGIGITRTDTPSRYSDTKKKFEGKSGSGAVKIDIKSSFGNIMIGKGSETDMKEKKKVRT